MGRRRSFSYSVDTTVDVDIDVDDLLEDLDDEDLLEEVKKRGYKLADPDTELTRADIAAITRVLEQAKPLPATWWGKDALSALEKLYLQ